MGARTRDHCLHPEERGSPYGLAQSRSGSLARTVPDERPCATILDAVEQKSTRTRSSTLKPPRAPAWVRRVHARPLERTVTVTASCGLKAAPWRTSGRSLIRRRLGPWAASAEAASAAASNVRVTSRKTMDVSVSKQEAGDISRNEPTYQNLDLPRNR
jgi:hypothetical protein